jgi:hypothetical protein
MKIKPALLVAIAAGYALTLRADTITMKSGSKFEGVVVSESAESITLRRGYGMMYIQRSDVMAIEKTPIITAPPKAKTNDSEQRITSESKLIEAVLATEWAKDLQQIPATVIDNGNLRFVPYTSYRCAEDYEINIYGDPDRPAGIEIGIYRKLLDDPHARKNCLSLIVSVLFKEADRVAVAALKPEKDEAEVDGVTMEITPASDPDAYGGWWISIYDMKALDASRASPEELSQITVAKESKPITPAMSVIPEPARAVALPSMADASEVWTPTEMRQSKSVENTVPSSGNRVYVRSYTRKDGTYVHSHTRAASGGGRRGR